MFTKMNVAAACFLLSFFVVCSNGMAAEAASPSKEKVKSSPSVQKPHSKPGVLAGLRKEHPRLLFTKADQQRVEKLAKSNPVLAEMITQLKKNAERILTEPGIQKTHITKRQRNTLDRSRCCLARILTLSMAYRLTGDMRFAKRARKEMLAAAAFKTWNPRHFLDVGEMSCAMAIGYDWLYDTLSKADRETIRKAIVAKALEPGMAAYLRAEKRKRPAWWCNWSQVCNSGLVLGALAVAEDEPELAAKVISRAQSSVRTGMSLYKPDGVWPEGVVYWVYGTNFNALLISALDTALGNDSGLSDMKGFDKTGDFLMHVSHGKRRCFGYADSGGRLGITPAMFFLAKKFNRPEYAWVERQRMLLLFEKAKRQSDGFKIHYPGPSRLYAMQIAWFDERGTAGDLHQQKDVLLRGVVPIVAMRSEWKNTNALYLGLKGGISNMSHGHLDIGSFVLAADDVAWAIDLGKDSYSLPGIWDRREKGQRWKYYRLGSQSHNTLVINGKRQRVSKEKNDIIRFSSTPAHAHAVIDMSNAYKGQAKKVLRGIAMLDRKAVLIQDEITAPTGEVRWGMLTTAKIKLNGAKATLTKDGKTLSAEILAPAGDRFKIVTPPKPVKKEYARPKSLSMLAVSVKPAENGKKPMHITVLLKPVGPRWGKLPLPKLRPLSKWENAGNAK